MKVTSICVGNVALKIVKRVSNDTAAMYIHRAKCLMYIPSLKAAKAQALTSSVISRALEIKHVRDQPPLHPWFHHGCDCIFLSPVHFNIHAPEEADKGTLAQQASWVLSLSVATFHD